jgi:hypothetical protein
MRTTEKNTFITLAPCSGRQNGNHFPVPIPGNFDRGLAFPVLDVDLKDRPRTRFRLDSEVEQRPDDFGATVAQFRQQVKKAVAVLVGRVRVVAKQGVKHRQVLKEQETLFAFLSFSLPGQSYQTFLSVFYEPS